MEMEFNKIISLLTSAEIQQELFLIKIVFFAVAGFFIGMIVFVLMKTHFLEWLFFQSAGEFLTFRAFGAKLINRRWQKIKRRLETGSESDCKLAVIEADNMLDSSLRRMGFYGQSLEEKLDKLSPATLPNLEDIHQVHQLRNSIVHNPDQPLSVEDAKRAIESYEKAFTDLQILT